MIRLKSFIFIVILASLVYLSFYAGKTNNVLFVLAHTNQTNIDFKHNNGHIKNYKYPEIMGSGVAVIDFDLDGDLDLYFVQSGAGNESDQLYKSLYKETGLLQFENVTKTLGIQQNSFGMGVSVADYNNDSYPDILIANIKKNILLKNIKGQHFDDVSKVSTIGLESKLSISSAFMDIDQDGWVDIIILNNIKYNSKIEPKCLQKMGSDYCGPNSFLFEKNSIYQNHKGVFKYLDTDKTAFTTELPSLAVSVLDINNDALGDIYIANDGQVNSMWVSSNDFKFTNQGFYSGLAVNSMAKVESSMGIATGDINSDGLLNLYLTHMWQETNTLYMQNSSGRFSDETNQFKLAQPSFQYTGFGTAFLDFENDGDLDIVVANGAIMKNQDGNYNEENSFYENLGNKFTLLDNTKILTVNKKFTSRGLARADLDNDGDSDIIISNNNAEPEIYINQSEKNANNWIGYIAIDHRGLMLENLESIAQYDKKIVRNIQTRLGSYASSSDPRVLMGLGDYNAQVIVTIRWNKHEFEKFADLSINKYHKLVRGNGVSVNTWPSITNPQVIVLSTKQQFERSLNDLLTSAISAASRTHLTQLKTTTVELCYSLQSYEYITQASLCYSEYFLKNKKIDASTYYLASLNEINKRDYNQAQKYLDEAIIQNPKQWLFYVRKTQAYIFNQEYEIAQIYLQKCQELNPDIFNTKLAADIYFGLEKYRQAFVAYREVLKLQPQATHLYRRLAESLKHFQSQEIVNIALAKVGNVKLKLLDPIQYTLIGYNQNPDFYFDKALLANMNSEINIAVNNMARAYELDPNSEEIIRNYVLLLEKSNQVSKAVKLIEQKIAKITQVDSYIAFATILSRANRVTEAQVIYRNALLQFPNNIRLLTNFANNFLRQKDFNNARKYYNKILKLEADNKNAIQALKNINTQQSNTLKP